MNYVTVRLPSDVGERLREIAKRNCRSMASQISYLLKKYREEEETFEEYYERNKSYLDEAYNDAKQGKNCIAFSSWEEALDFLNTKKKEWKSEK